MSAHRAIWQEYNDVDDRTFLAMTIHLLIEEIWERHCAADMQTKHGIELDPQEERDLLGNILLDVQELPLEIEDPDDPWVVEQERRIGLAQLIATKEDSPTTRTPVLAHRRPLLCTQCGRRQQLLQPQKTARSEEPVSFRKRRD